MFRYNQNAARWTTLSAAVVVAAFAVAAGAFGLERPLTEDDWTPVALGVDVASWTRDYPPVSVYAARVDLTTSGLVMKASSRVRGYKENSKETRRETTLEFLKRNDLSFAVNTNYYVRSWRESFMKGRSADVRGLAISNGIVVSPAEEGYISILFRKDAPPEIKRVFPEDDVSDVVFAFSGRKAILTAGTPCPPKSGSVRTTRTAVGLSKDRLFLYFIVIEGRRKGEGAYFDEEGRELLRCGAYDGFNLDGGGSSTMVVRDSHGRVVVLNHPQRGSVKGLRRNANAFGVRAPDALSNDR